MINPGDEKGLSLDANPATPQSVGKTGLAAWMNRVLIELDRTRRDFNPDAVHDLRVALRRCLAIADLHMAVDPLEAWVEMRKAGRKLFKRLGDLRDVQVMREWIGHLAGEQDPAGIQLGAHLSDRENELRQQAAEAVAAFNRKQWLKWLDRLGRRTIPLTLEDQVFQQFALERWQVARDLHRQALRNRSRAAFHRLRIGLKRFRYTVENFLPQRHEYWGPDLRLLQDALGELHDLFVLWRTALDIGALADRELRSRWRERIEAESLARLLTYRSKAVGRGSVWALWRAGLPRDHELELAAETRIRIWASLRDPDFERTLKVADLALQLFDGLEREGIIATAGTAEVRSVLRIAAIMSNVGKENRKQIRKSGPPVGFPLQTFALAALAGQYPRGAISKPEGKHMAILTDAQKKMLHLAVAILYLADAFVGKDGQGIRHLKVSRLTDALLISADGYREDGAMARKLAAARHPLEVACHAPILIRPLLDMQ